MTTIAGHRDATSRRAAEISLGARRATEADRGVGSARQISGPELMKAGSGNDCPGVSGCRVDQQIQPLTCSKGNLGPEIPAAHAVHCGASSSRANALASAIRGTIRLGVVALHALRQGSLQIGWQWAGSRETGSLPCQPSCNERPSFTTTGCATEHASTVSPCRANLGGDRPRQVRRISEEPDCPQQAAAKPSLLAGLMRSSSRDPRTSTAAFGLGSERRRGPRNRGRSLESLWCQRRR